MSTNNICFHREIRKILCGYPLLSVAMIFLQFSIKCICCTWVLIRTSNEYPQHMFLWKNKRNFPQIITKYSSLTTPLTTEPINLNQSAQVYRHNLINLID